MRIPDPKAQLLEVSADNIRQDKSSFESTTKVVDDVQHEFGLSIITVPTSLLLLCGLSREVVTDGGEAAGHIGQKNKLKNC